MPEDEELKCQRCDSVRIMDISGKCIDSFWATYDGDDFEGFVPDDIGIGEEII